MDYFLLINIFFGVRKLISKVTKKLYFSGINGFVDNISANKVSGWVWDSHRPFSKIQCEYSYKGSIRGKCVANEYREDLAKNGIGDGYHGFTIILEEKIVAKGELRVFIGNNKRKIKLPFHKILESRKVKKSTLTFSYSLLEGKIVIPDLQSDILDFNFFINETFISKVRTNENGYFSEQVPLFFIDSTVHNVKLYDSTNNQLIVDQNLKFSNNLIDEMIKGNYFDLTYYNSQFDKQQFSLIENAIDHYIKYGWKKGLNPSKDFDSAYYLQVNTDVKRANFNPLLHYLSSGKSEGRETKSVLNANVLDLVYKRNSRLLSYNRERTEFEIENIALNKVYFIIECHDYKKNELQSLLNSITVNKNRVYLIDCKDKKDFAEVIHYLSISLALNKIKKADAEAQIFFAKYPFVELNSTALSKINVVKGKSSVQTFDLQYVDNRRKEQVLRNPGMSREYFYEFTLVQCLFFINGLSQLDVCNEITTIDHLIESIVFKDKITFTNYDDVIGKIANIRFESKSYLSKYTQFYGSKMDKPSSVSIIIPFKDKKSYLERCLMSILKYKYIHDIEILLVDNMSSEFNSHEFVKEFKNLPKNITLKVLNFNESFNYAKINNFAAASSTGDYLLLLNNDTEVINENWLDEMLVLLKFDDIGAVGSLLYFEGDNIQHAGVVMGIKGLAHHAFYNKSDEQIQFSMHKHLREVTAVTAACLLTKRALFFKIGGLDENFVVCGNDVDYCLRLRKSGFRIMYTPYSKLYHYESVSRDSSKIPRGDFRQSLRSYYYYLIYGDPFYNTNLTLLNTELEDASADEYLVLRKEMNNCPGWHTYFG